jgi:hypothetical protein
MSADVIQRGFRRSSGVCWRDRCWTALIIALVLMAAAACGGPVAPARRSGAIVLVADQPSEPIDVPARANIFGAGHDVPPDPGGGGPGVLPPVVRLPPGDGHVLTFPQVVGSVNPIAADGLRPGADFVGPAGDGGRFGTTDVASFDGISGVIHRKNGMFLVGVFLADAAPSTVAPARLDFTEHRPSDVITPEIGQTFLVGDGHGAPIPVPEGATRLFLGFADSFLYQGQPGWYGNNDGRLTVTVRVAPR